MLSKKLCVVVACLCFQFLSAISAQAVVETKKLLTIKSSGSPVDTAVSSDGRWFFVLTSQGQVEIHDATGASKVSLKDTIKLDGPADRIASSPNGEQLFLTDQASGSINVIAVSFVQEIDTTGAPFKGPEKAPVVVSVFSDFQCPYCARVGALMEQVMKAYPNEVKVVYKNFPLQSHQMAQPAAFAALAAHRQGKFWEMHDKIFENSSNLSPEKFTELAKGLGLNMEQFAKDSDDPALKQQVQQDFQNGVKADVRGTPTLFVNGRRVTERGLEGIKAMVDAELTKLKK